MSVSFGRIRRAYCAQVIQKNQPPRVLRVTAESGRGKTDRLQQFQCLSTQDRLTAIFDAELAMNVLDVLFDRP